MTILETTIPDAGVDGHAAAAPPENRASIPHIRELQAQRVATIKSRLRIANQARALVRRCLGWRADLPEADRAKIAKLAAKIVVSIEKGTDPPAGEEAVADVARPFVLCAQQSRSPFDSLQRELEKDMVRQAKMLPVWPWVEAVNGFGVLGLAIIVGECGSLSEYAGPAKVWKRMGLAVMGENRQGNPGNGACADEWIEHGYSPRRRSAMWTIGDSLLKKQNAYRDLYLGRKAFEAERDPEKTKMHCHRRAQRYVEKRLLRDLWRAWRDA